MTVNARRLVSLNDWSPSSLFTAGTKGFFHDFSNIGAVYTAAGLTGTVSATATAVLSMRDFSGQNNQATRLGATAATWTAATDGCPFLTFPATAQAYTHSNATVQNVQSYTVCLAIRPTTIAGDFRVLYSSITNTGTDDRYTVYINPTGSVLTLKVSRPDLTAATMTAAGALALNTDYIILAEMNWFTAFGELRVNRQITRTAMSTVGLTDNSTSQNCGFGGFPDTPSNPFVGRMYAIFGIANRILTEGEKQSAMSWMARKTPTTGGM